MCTGRSKPTLGLVLWSIFVWMHVWMHLGHAAFGQAADAKTPDNASPDDASPAILIPIELPIDGNADLAFAAQVEQLLDQLEDSEERPTLVLQFDSSSETSGSSRYTRCEGIARFLVSEKLRRVRTVAYVPHRLTGHAVLIAIACEEIVMSPTAEIGDAGYGDEFIDGAKRHFYEDIALRRRTMSAEMALSMLDASAGFAEVTTLDDSEKYVNLKELSELKAANEVVNSETIVPSGQHARFNGRELRRRFGYVSRLVDSPDQLSTALGLPIRPLDSLDQFDGEGKAAKLELRGPISAEKVNRIVRALGDERNDAYRRVVLVIDSPGGSPKHSLRLANALAQVQRDKTRQVITYIDGVAHADAAWIALSGSRLTMQTDAILGGPGEWQPSESQRKDLEGPVGELAADIGVTRSLLESLADSQVSLFEYQHKTTAEVRLYAEDEIQQLRDADNWQRGPQVFADEGFTSEVAVERELCNDTFANLGELKQRFQISDDLETLEQNPLIAKIEALAMSPWFSATLMIIAFSALMTEASSPGLGVPGFVSALAFMFFFWAQFLNGTAGWLEVLLFVGGITAILVEVFVVPGFGVFGIGGGIMVLGSIVLASQTFVLPNNSHQLSQLPKSMAPVFAAMIGSGVAAYLLRRYLADIPYLRHLILQPSGVPADGDHNVEQREAMVDWSHLSNKVGTATSPLRPSGKARFGDDVFDVTCEKELIDRGEKVVVVEVVGNKIVVKRFSS